MKFLKNLKLSLRALADISTIIALVIGFYALINPGAVSDYLREISEASAAAEVSLGNIDTSSASGGPTQVHMSPTRAWGMKAVITVGAPTAPARPHAARAVCPAGTQACRKYARQGAQ